MGIKLARDFIQEKTVFKNAKKTEKNQRIVVPSSSSSSSSTCVIQIHSSENTLKSALYDLSSIDPLLSVKIQISSFLSAFVFEKKENLTCLFYTVNEEEKTCMCVYTNHHISTDVLSQRMMLFPKLLEYIYVLTHDEQNAVKITGKMNDEKIIDISSVNVSICSVDGKQTVPTNEYVYVYIWMCLYVCVCVR